MTYQTDVPKINAEAKPIIFFPKSSTPILYMNKIEKIPNKAEGNLVVNSLTPKNL